MTLTKKKLCNARSFDVFIVIGSIIIMNFLSLALPVCDM